jgi:hypothetical protein
MLFILIGLVTSISAWAIVRWLFPRANFYVYDYVDGRRRKYIVGYVRGNDGAIIDLAEPTGRRRVGQVVLREGRGYVRLADGDDPRNFEEVGFVDSEGRIFSSKDTSQPVTESLVEGNRYWYELWLRRHTDVGKDDEQPNGTVIESVRLTGRKSNEPSLLAKGAAALCLYYRSRRSSEETPTLFRSAFWDVALLASGVYTILFLLEGYTSLLVSLITADTIFLPLLGPEISHVVSLFLFYFVVWGLLFIAKNFLLSNSNDPIIFLEMVNRHTGISGWTNAGVVLAIGGIVWSILVSGYVYVPLYLAISIGLLTSRMAGGPAWKVEPRSRSTDLPGADGDGERSSAGDELREYTWELRTPMQTFVFNSSARFDSSEIQQARTKNPFWINWEDAARDSKRVSRQLVLEGETATQVQDVARYIMRRQLTRIDEIQAALSFAQNGNIDYAVDKDCDEIGNRQEYFRFPAETLFDKKGDCDCKSVLAAALMRCLGYPVLLLLSHQEEHAALAVGGFGVDDAPAGFSREFNGRMYYFCETTGDGWTVGATSDTAVRMLQDPDAPVDLTSDRPQVFQ